MNEKKVRLTSKEIARADRSDAGRLFTIVVRPQSEGGYWVAAVDVTTGQALGYIGLAQALVEGRNQIPAAIKSIGRDLHKFLGLMTDMTDRMRHGRSRS